MASGRWGRDLTIGTAGGLGRGGQPAGLDATDDREPQEVINWALSTFARGRVAICTAFQIDGMAILDMAWRIDPQVRGFTLVPGVPDWMGSQRPGGAGAPRGRQHPSPASEGRS